MSRFVAHRLNYFFNQKCSIRIRKIFKNQKLLNPGLVKSKQSRADRPADFREGISNAYGVVHDVSFYFYTQIKNLFLKNGPFCRNLLFDRNKKDSKSDFSLLSIFDRILMYK